MVTKRIDEEQVFHIARAIQDVNARSKYLYQVCEDDSQLRKRVEHLLEVQESESEFLKSNNGQTNTLDHLPITAKPGQRIGRYKLLQEIGEGGFGTVFMAEQLEPLKRRVALKVIKPGMDSKEVVARFEAERQALAMMDHPNIAKVLDAGTTESGHPYFVMEMVKGVPITTFADENKLSVKDRLQLFVKVCQAVQHAHQKGVIHRDIKPSNVLVTLHDGVPVPKIIDFGVSKALNQQLTEKTLFTKFGQIIGTPQYMSPEQAEMSGLDVDTRSDVYSLGVLLYEILTGRPPFDADSLREAGFDEMRRIIREQNPQKPSERMRTLDRDTASIVATSRAVQPKALSRFLQGELDWIVMRSLEKNRERRFDSAGNFALDIQRYLDGEAVQTTAPSTAYLLWKALKKHRAAFSIAAVIFLMTAIAAVVSYSSYLSAAQDRDIAVDERKNADAAKQVAIEVQEKLAKEQALNNRSLDLFYTVFHSHYANVILLSHVYQKSREEFKDSPETEYEINHRIGTNFILRGYLKPEVFQRQLELSKTLFGNESLESAEALRYLGYCKSDPTRIKQAIQIEREKLDGKAKFQSLSALGELYVQSNQLDDALSPLIEATECFDFDQYDLQFTDNPFLWLSEVYRRQNEPDEYIKYLKLGLEYSFKLLQRGKKQFMLGDEEFDDLEFYVHFGTRHLQRREFLRAEWFRIMAFLLATDAEDLEVFNQITIEEKGDWQSALIGFLRSPQISNDAKNSGDSTSIFTNNKYSTKKTEAILSRIKTLATTYRFLGYSELAICFYRAAIDVANKLNRADRRANAIGWQKSDLARSYRNIGDSANYIHHLRQAELDFAKTGSPWNIVYNKYELAMALSGIGKDAEAQKLFTNVASNLDMYVKDPYQDLWSEQADWAVYIISMQMCDSPVPPELTDLFWEQFSEFASSGEGYEEVAAALMCREANETEKAFKYYTDAFAEIEHFYPAVEQFVIEMSALQYFVDKNRPELSFKLIQHLVNQKEKQLYVRHPQRAISRIRYAEFLINNNLQLTYANQLLSEAKSEIHIRNKQIRDRHLDKIAELEKEIESK